MENFNAEDVLKMQRQRARSRAFVFASSVFLTGMFFIYGIIQKMEADRQAARAYQAEKIAQEERQQSAQQAEKMLKHLEQVEFQRSELEALLKNCNAGR